MQETLPPGLTTHLATDDTFHVIFACSDAPGAAALDRVDASLTTGRLPFVGHVWLARPPLPSLSLSHTLRITFHGAAQTRVSFDGSREGALWARIAGAAPEARSAPELREPGTVRLEIHTSPDASACERSIRRVLAAARALRRGGRTLEGLARRSRPLEAIGSMAPLERACENDELLPLAQVMAARTSLSFFMARSDLLLRRLNTLTPLPFWSWALDLCEIESRTFLSDEARSSREKLLAESQTFRERIQISLGLRCDGSEWRHLVGLAVAQKEWMEDVGYRSLNSMQQKLCITESPAWDLLPEPVAK